MVHQSGKVGWSAASCGNAGTRRDDGIFGGLAVLYAGRFPARRARRFVDSSGSRRRSTRRSWLRPSRNSSRTHCGSRGNGPAFGVPQPLVVGQQNRTMELFCARMLRRGPKTKPRRTAGFCRLAHRTAGIGGIWGSYHNAPSGSLVARPLSLVQRCFRRPAAATKRSHPDRTALPPCGDTLGRAKGARRSDLLRLF
jgi:hypothetical protein